MFSDFWGKSGVSNYLLLPLSAVFWGLSTTRRWLYKVGVFKVVNFKVPIVIVGNITVGGSGKTPVVIALVKHFKQQGKKVGVVSRGYKGVNNSGNLWVDETTNPAKSGDEPLLIFRETKVAVVVNKNRVDAAKALIDKGYNLIISDDGLQHYRLGRAVEIAVVNGFGNGFLLPAGGLREGKSRLQSVDFVLDNSDGQIDAGFKIRMQALIFINLKNGEQKPLDYFAGKECYAVAGVANPLRFIDTLGDLKVKTTAIIFPDHHHFKAKDLEFPLQNPIIMTSKDYVKCADFASQNMWYLDIEADLNKDFLTQLEQKL